MTVRTLEAPTEPASRRRGPGIVATIQATLGEYAASRELVMNLVRRDLTVQHRGTVFGRLWSLATPLLMVGLYTFIFTVLLPVSPVREGVDIPFAVYLFVGLVLWNLFSAGVVGGAGSVLGGAYLLKKVYFRREILPLTSVIAGLVTFAFELSVALVAVIFLVGVPDWHIVWLPLIVLVVVTMSLGVGLFLSAAVMFFRDIEHFIGVGMQVWFWGTPIIYSLDLVADKPLFLRLLQLNPMTGPIVSFRNIMLLNSAPDWPLLGWSAAVALVCLVGGFAFFRRNQRRFAEMV